MKPKLIPHQRNHLKKLSTVTLKHQKEVGHGDKYEIDYLREDNPF